jgi:hypothetical protein
MRLAAALAAVLAVPAASVAAPKKADKAPAAGDPANPASGKGPVAKAPGLCGGRIFPLVEGNQWTYEAVTTQQPLADNDPRKRLSPPQPKSVAITVKSVDNQKAADTVVTLEEKVTTEVVQQGSDASGKQKPPIADVRTLTTTITCNAKGKFEVSPDSFFATGEPGGAMGLTIDKIDRSHDTSWKLTNGGIGDATWREEIVAHWTRTPTPGSDAKLGSGKLELEHAFTPQNPELIITKVGSYKSEKVGLLTTGRITLDSALQIPTPQELPAGWLTTIWLAEGVGFVQVLNAYSHEYQLVDAKLK